MGRLAVCMLLALPACDVVFKLKDPPGNDAPVGGQCAVQTTSDLRYRAESSQGDWIGERTNCARYGMDLVTFGSKEEFDDVAFLGVPPYWIGVRGSDNTTQDDCAAHLDLIEPPNTPDGCMLVRQDFKMDRISCEQNTYLAGGAGMSALCETPRPSEACRARPVPTSYVNTGSNTFRDAASTMCAALPEINSEEDLAALDTFMRANSIIEVWLAPKYDGEAWGGASGCPNLFRWNAGQPQVTLGLTFCVSYNVNDGASSRGCASEAARVICETR